MVHNILLVGDVSP